MSFDAGKQIGRYVIQSLLGEGGMGQVYLALDTALGRTVALKLLPVEVAEDKSRMHRFIQEAKAASALNHPNIITIHEIGEEEGINFIVTEFIDGLTLRERLKRGRLPLSEVLDIAAQVAGALAAAHAAGIVHRDIKPENIMLRADGYVKVLDFGLAKLTGRASSQIDTEAVTKALVNTSPGAVMGTVSYMSPEQARGLEVDARTDLWSLGVVLYEMLAGRVPFAGASPSHVIVSILDHEPPPLSLHMLDAPEALQEIVTDALAKDKEARFQTAKQMLARLQRLKQRLEAGLHLDRSISPDYVSQDSTGAGRSQSQPSLSSADRTTGHASAAPTVQTSAYPEQTQAPPKRRRAATILALSLALFVLAATGYGLYRFVLQRRAARTPIASLQNMKFTKLLAPGRTAFVVISPDGNYAARVVQESGKQSLRLRQLATTNEKELVPPREESYLGASFSPDGNFVYYVSGDTVSGYRNLYRVSPLGGETRKLVSDVDSIAAVSPDGTRLAFRRHLPKTNEDTLVLAREDGSNEQTVLVRKPPVTMTSLAWSPDRQLLAFVVKGTDENGYYMNLEALRLSDGTTQVISAARWRTLGPMTWLADGSGLVTNARDRASLPSTPEQVWFIPYPAGEPQRVTNDVNYYTNVSLSADSHSLLATQVNNTVDMWLLPGGDITRARQMTTDGSSGTPAWTPDNRILYQSGASGNGDIWVMNADGSGARQLTFDPNNDTLPAISPDGQRIVFVSNRSVGWSIWLMNADGSDQHELVRNIAPYSFPHFSPDSREVFYTSNDQHGDTSFWRVPVAGGAPSKVVERKVGNSLLAPDGKSFFTVHSEPVPNARREVLIVRLDGSGQERVMEAPAGMDMPKWSPDGQAIDYVVRRDGVTSLWRLPLNGGQPRQLTDLKADFLNWYDWSKDSRQLAVARGTEATDLILVKNFR